MITNILRIRTGITVSLLLVFTLVGCGGGGGSSYTTTPNPEATVQVVTCPGSEAATVDAVGTSIFNPASVTISANQVVKWTNTSGYQHTVTSTTVPANGAFDAALNNGTSVCLKFTAVGTYHYKCTFHPTMTGSVTVN